MSRYVKLGRNTLATSIHYSKFTLNDIFLILFTTFIFVFIRRDPIPSCIITRRIWINFLAIFIN